MKKRKVLFIMQLPPPVHGVSVMNEIIHKSKLINDSLACEYINLATSKSIDELRKSGFRKYLTTFQIVLKTIFKLSTNRYGYVYITIFPFGYAFYKDAIMVLLARLFRQKTLLHLHTHGFKTAASKSKFVEWFYSFVFKGTDVICLSDFLLEDIETIYNGKVFILPNGIPQVNFENEYKIHNNKLTILYLSNLIKGKGILLLTQALKELKQKGYNVSLKIVGAEGNLSYHDLENNIRDLGIENEVSLIGPKFGKDKFDELRKADMLVLPSNYDTFGLVLLEAMQFGIPCIASSIGGIPDVLGQGRGVLLKGIDVESIVEALIFLIENPNERTKISNLAFNYFKVNFTQEVFLQRLLNILVNKPDKVNQSLVNKG